MATYLHYLIGMHYLPITQRHNVRIHVAGFRSFPIAISNPGSSFAGRGTGGATRRSASPPAFCRYRFQKHLHAVESKPRLLTNAQECLRVPLQRILKALVEDDLIEAAGETLSPNEMLGAAFLALARPQGPVTEACDAGSSG